MHTYQIGSQADIKHLTIGLELEERPVYKAIPLTFLSPFQNRLICKLRVLLLFIAGFPLRCATSVSHRYKCICLGRDRSKHKENQSILYLI